MDLDEFDTRKLIDQQLRDAGWDADTTTLKHSLGVRPERGRDMAIAEWPTDNGIADYVLFRGLTPLAVVEAKRSRRAVRSAIDQAERYSKSFRQDSNLQDPGGPWNGFRIPFLFAANGRPFHRQFLSESGVWFRDARRPMNHARPLTGWYTPEGLADLLKLDVDAATAKLKSEPSTYLPLHYYQRDAIEAVEDALAKGKTEMLVAMATGTARLVWQFVCYIDSSKPSVQPILFLVDRTALGDQAHDSFRDVKLENYQAFTDIYEVKNLGTCDRTRNKAAHFNHSGNGQTSRRSGRRPETVPCDQYDLIVIDECHRGYVLDREMSELELSYRDQLDYVSKYRRVLDHFDSIRLGLTATPALHTTEIFGRPVYEYTYRQAVIDNFLVDHEPPYIIKTELSEKGMHWKPGETVQKLRTLTGEIVTEIAKDEIDIDIDGSTGSLSQRASMKSSAVFWPNISTRNQKVRLWFSV